MVKLWRSPLDFKQPSSCHNWYDDSLYHVSLDIVWISRRTPSIQCLPFLSHFCSLLQKGKKREEVSHIHKDSSTQENDVAWFSFLSSKHLTISSTWSLQRARVKTQKAILNICFTVDQFSDFAFRLKKKKRSQSQQQQNNSQFSWLHLKELPWNTTWAFVSNWLK